MKSTTLRLCSFSAATALALVTVGWPGAVGGWYGTPFGSVPVASAEETTITERATNATITLDKDVEKGQKELKVKGTGWLDIEKTGGSTIVIKARYKYEDGESGDYSQKTNIPNHPTSGAPDPTIWATVKVDSDGTFETVIPVPENIEAGQRLTLNFASGLLEGDYRRSLTVPLVVDGVPYEGEELEECITEEPAPRVEVAENANSDGTLDVEGWGWCNEYGGGVKITVKINDGTISRPAENQVHPNTTIWSFIESDPHDGTFKTKVTLPDGTTSGPRGSLPAFKEGLHSVIFLSGSLNEGDPQANPRKSFVYGEYRPSPLAPDPVHPSILTAMNDGDLEVTRRNNSLELTLPQGQEGDWVFASVYNDGGPNLPWTDWYQLGPGGTLSLPTQGKQFQTGQLKLVLQNGNRGLNGEVVGWAPVTLATAGTTGTTSGGSTQTTTTTATTTSVSSSAAPTTGILAWKTTFDDITREVSNLDNILSNVGGAASSSAAPTTQQSGSGSTQPSEVVEVVEVIGGGGVAPTRGFGVVSGTTNAGGGGGGVTLQQPTGIPATPQPETVPSSPVRTGDGLTTANIGQVQGHLSDDYIFTATATDNKPGDWVYVYGFTPDKQDFGWVQLDENSSIAIDVSDLGDGEHKFAIVDEDGKLIGWSGIALSAESADDGTGYGPGGHNIQAAGLPRPLMATSDWLIIVGSIALVQLLGIGAYALRKGARY